VKAVADASVLIALGAVGKLGLLREMWKAVLVPPAALLK
jgi:predicted nucleic acid-binding protein